MLFTFIDYNSSLWTCDFWSENFIQFEAFLQVAPFCIIEWSSKCKRWTFSASVHFANKNNAARMKGLFIDVNFDGIEKLPDLGHKESTRPVKGDVHLLRQVFLEQFWKWQKESQFYEIFYLDVCLSCRRSETRAVRSAADGRTMAEVLSNRQIMSRPTNPSPWILYITPFIRMEEHQSYLFHIISGINEYRKRGHKEYNCGNRFKKCGNCRHLLLYLRRAYHLINGGPKKTSTKGQANILIFSYFPIWRYFLIKIYSEGEKICLFWFRIRQFRSNAFCLQLVFCLLIIGDMMIDGNVTKTIHV